VPSATGQTPSSALVAVATIAVVALLALGPAACGGGSDGGGSSGSTPSASDFPSAEGRTIEDVLAAQTPSELVVSPAASVFELGKNRYPFGVFNVDRSQVDDAEVALYFAKTAQSPVQGPLPATVETLETKPAFRSKGSEAPGEATSVYVVPDVRFDRSGPWLAIALINGDDGMEGARLPSPTVGQFPGVAQVGQKAPRVSTPTAASVGGDLSKIDTRQPPSSMHDADLEEVLGKKPVVLLFATPALCQSRVCGPTVDSAEQVKAEVGDGVEFIHMEIYNENDPAKGLRPQLAAYGLQTEPWVFLIGSDGKIKQRMEGAFGVEELRTAVEDLKAAETPG
jgi:hypothetical protein